MGLTSRWQLQISFSSLSQHAYLNHLPWIYLIYIDDSKVMLECTVGFRKTFLYTTCFQSLFFSVVLKSKKIYSFFRNNKYTILLYEQNAQFTKQGANGPSPTHTLSSHYYVRWALLIKGSCFFLYTNTVWQWTCRHCITLIHIIVLYSCNFIIILVEVWRLHVPLIIEVFL